MKKRKIKVETVYRTSDGRAFSGSENSKEEAITHQNELDERRQRMLLTAKRLDTFDAFMREMFGIKSEYDPDKYPEDEEDFCQEIMKSVPIYADEGDFRDEISQLFLKLFNFVGPSKWLKIHDFLTSERWKEL